MKTLVVYESRFGNTALIARAVADALREWGAAHLLAVDEVTAPDLAGLDLLVVGGPTHAHGPSPELGGWLKGLPAGRVMGLPVAAFDMRFPMAKFLTEEAVNNTEAAHQAMLRYVELEKANTVSLSALASFYSRRARFTEQAATLERLILKLKKDENQHQKCI